MASEETATSDPQINFVVKASNDTKYPLSLAGSATVADLKQKLSGADYADAPAERLRLIFSGRVLKDGDTISGSKIKEGHTIHLVKSAASNIRQNPAASSGSPAPAAVPTNIATGTGNNPLAALTGARYAGFHGLPSASSFGADGGMTQGMNPDDFERMLEDPNFLQQMNEMMDSPAFQQMLLDNPIFRDNPMARQMIRDPAYRRVLMNPQIMLQQMRAQQRASSQSARSSFPAPGNTDNTAEAAANSGSNTDAAANPFGAGANPFAQLGAGNPFAALLNPQGAANPSGDGSSAGADSDAQAGMPSLDSLLSGMPPDFFRAMGGAPGAAGTGQGATDGTGATGGLPNPDFMAATMRLMQNPDFQTLARNMPGGMPGGMPGFGAPGAGAAGSPPAGGAANPFADFYGALGGMGGMGGMAPPRAESPADTRPPEERYADQLRQLNDMGFFDFDSNVQALRRSGGSVQGAVEHLLSSP